MFKFINLKSANDGKHKYKITVENIATGKIHKVKFGAYCYDDYTLSKKQQEKGKLYSTS